jgi:hypothetical protein
MCDLGALGTCTGLQILAGKVVLVPYSLYAFVHCVVKSKGSVINQLVPAYLQT